MDRVARYRLNHRDHLAQLQRDYRAEIRRQVLEFFGSKCVQCGFDDIRALQLDHINGGGTQEWKRLGSSTQVWRRALKHPKDYQLLCCNCNWIKRLN